RPDTVEWVKGMGADHVINHRESLVDQMKALGLQPRYVASRHYSTTAPSFAQ
ncbi:MAG: NADPH2:quinone reductase, partial [Lentimonas sp.]